MPKHHDSFGLQREMTIIRSGVRKVFVPHQPINNTDLFFGREKEITKIIEQINTPGQHSLLYGERGVGKSSLANIASELIFSELVKGRLYLKRCDSATIFETLLQEPLKDAGVDITIKQMDSTRKRGGKALFKIPVIESGFDSEKEESELREGPAVYVSPSFAAEILQSVRGLLVVDEADALREKKDKTRLAEFVKLLSDSDAQFKVLIVGVAQFGGELIAEHKSVERCLRETKLDRMADAELARIVIAGADLLSLVFDNLVIRKIVSLSAGYPHFTHLLALKCAEDAIGGNYGHITLNHLNAALEKAVEDAEGSLKRAFTSAVRSSGTNMYQGILSAAAYLYEEEFSSKQLRESIYEQTGERISQNNLNNYLKRLVSDQETTILRRSAKGIYRFNDPRMPSYIRIEAETRKLGKII